MNYVLDTSSLLNLAEGEVLQVVLSLNESEFYFGSQVKREAPTHAVVLDGLISGSFIYLIDDGQLSAQEFFDLKRALLLGDGEIECIQAANKFGYTLSCDDWAARRAATKILGESRVTGSIGLLRRCVREGLLSAREAFGAYELMKARGGFLPPLAIDFLSS